MQTKNGIEIYDQNERPPVPDGLKADIEIVSRYGFKVVEIEGKKMWEAATERDYRESVARLHGISPEDVDVDVRFVCAQIGPTRCYGDCGFPGARDNPCILGYDPLDQHYFCLCALW